jgi:DNA-binding PadR family transcriptional regulator
MAVGSRKARSPSAPERGTERVDLYYETRIRTSFNRGGSLARPDDEIRLGIWKIHVLHHAATREVWGKWLIEELAEHGHRLSPGTLYPALARMETNGWLRRAGKARHARARQTFRITPAGRRLLERLQRDVAELYQELVLGHEPAHEPRDSPERGEGPSTRARARKGGAAGRGDPR